jgi:hypothetical protein
MSAHAGNAQSAARRTAPDSSSPRPSPASSLPDTRPVHDGPAAAAHTAPASGRTRPTRRHPLVSTPGAPAAPDIVSVAADAQINRRPVLVRRIEEHDSRPPGPAAGARLSGRQRASPRPGMAYRMVAGVMVPAWMRPMGCLRQDGSELLAACGGQCVQRKRPAGGAGDRCGSLIEKVIGPIPPK